jgi:hypothetical protein
MSLSENTRRPLFALRGAGRDQFLVCVRGSVIKINPLAPELLLFFSILAHPVYKLCIIQEPNKLALWNKLHFEEKKRRL